MTYINQMTCKYQRDDKSSHGVDPRAHFPPTQHRLQMLGKGKPGSFTSYHCCNVLRASFHTVYESQSYLMLPTPVGTSLTDNDPFMCFLYVNGI